MAEQVGVMSRCIKSLDGLAYTQYGRNLKTGSNFEDFVGANSANLVNGWWLPIIAGAGAVVDNLSTYEQRLGLIYCATGTTAAGRAGLNSVGVNQSAILFGAGQYTFECELLIYVLSTAIEEYTFHLGFNDLITGESTDGAYFYYDRAGSGVNWRLKTANGGVRTDIDSGIPVVAATYIKFKIVVNYAGTLVSYYINDVLAGTITTNIPVGVGKNTGSIINMIKSAGITPRDFNVDWCWLHYDLTVSR